MKTPITTLILATVFAPLSGVRQIPSTSQPTQTQAQSAPCTTGQSQAANNQSNKPGSFADRLRKKVDDASDKLSTRAGGVPLPKSGDVAGGKPKPCPPQAGASVAPAAQPAPALHLPTGVTTTWLCNPIIVSTDPSHTTTFITPDALTNAEPAQASAFEADGAKADPKAMVSCANLRRDPKNNKVFLAQ